MFLLTIGNLEHSIFCCCFYVFSSLGFLCMLPVHPLKKMFVNCPETFLYDPSLSFFIVCEISFSCFPPSNPHRISVRLGFIVKPQKIPSPPHNLHGPAVDCNRKNSLVIGRVKTMNFVTSLGTLLTFFTEKNNNI